MNTRKVWLGMLGAAAVALPAYASGGESSITHQMMMLMIQLGVILFAAKVGGMLFDHLRMPNVLGELCAGIVIGPYLLGSLPLPTLPHGIFPIASAAFPISTELYGISSVAAIVLLFMAGLETDIQLFIRYSFAGSMVGIGGVLASFLTGDLLCMAFSRTLFGEAYGFLHPSCLFLGIVSTATSVGITARLLSERRKTDTPEGVTILAGAVIDDVLGIVMLAIGLGVIGAMGNGGQEGIRWGHIGMIAAKSFGIWLIATAVGLLAARRISRLLQWFGHRGTMATLALALAMVVGGLFEEAGLAMIIGAYVTGLSLSRSDIRHLVREKMEPIYAFLTPIFFAVMGMLVNVKLFASPRIIGFGLLFTLVALLAKLVGCGIPARLCGFTALGSLRIGAGMMPRGEVALIVAGIGVAAGLLPQNVFSVAVLMTLLTTMLSPPLIVWLFDRPGPGKRAADADERAEPVVFNFPSEHTADLLTGKLLSTFEQDGFFVHTLNRDEHIYQASRGAVDIEFRRRGGSIEFQCRGAGSSFVSTALYEVLADFEQLVKDLRQPVDRSVVARRMMSAAPGATPGSPLAPFMDEAVIEPRLQGTTKEQIMDE
ncbi:MAG: cation:proton antiporter, partial [Kiritimatiellae bacterium]|nr:cation:proton antiporter [Kiritimatiellia bacterium]